MTSRFRVKEISTPGRVYHHCATEWEKVIAWIIATYPGRPRLGKLYVVCSGGSASLVPRLTVTPALCRFARVTADLPMGNCFARIWDYLYKRPGTAEQITTPLSVGMSLAERNFNIKCNQRKKQLDAKLEVERYYKETAGAMLETTDEAGVERQIVIPNKQDGLDQTVTF